MRGQRQEGGADSINVQSSGAITLTIGITAGEARQIAEDVARANFIEFQGTAQRLVDERVELLTRRFIDAVETSESARLDAVQDPDVQYSILTAQKEYARSGAEDLGDTLVDLLVDRCAAQTRGLRAIVLNEAIATVGRLTAQQVDALTTVWFTMRVKHTQISTHELFIEWLHANLSPHIQDLPMHGAAYDHLIYLGCASRIGAQQHLGGVWSRKYPGLFARGLTREDIPPALREHDEMFAPCLTNPDLLQVRAITADDARGFAERADLHHLADELVALLRSNAMSDEPTQEFVLSRLPELEPLVAPWRDTDLSNLYLSTVGTAIAHANWKRRQNGQVTSLAEWIPDEL